MPLTRTGRYWTPAAVTSLGPNVTVWEPTEEQKKERQRKIDEGAKVIPFGFARVLQEEQHAR